MHTMLPMLFAACAPALAGPQAFVGATVHPVASPPIADAVLLIEEGRITAVGPRGAVVVPPDVEPVDLTGKVIVPGLVDTHSHIGGGGLGEGSGPLQPAISAIDSIDPTHVSLERARAGGITTVNVMPGSGNLIGGQTAYLKLRDASVIDDLLLCDDRRTEVCGGMKMANGTNPQGEGGYPRTRMGAAAQLRERLLAVKGEMGSGKKGGLFKKRASAPATLTDPGDEALRQVLAKERTVHFHTHRADDIATILALREEFDLDIVLHHVSEAWKVADAIGEAQIPCSLIMIDSPGGKEEAVEFRAENGAELEQRGVPVSLHTDDAITDSRLFLRSAGLAVRAGMSEEAALKALTLAGAEQMHLEGRVGSLEVGKDADFVVLSGPPLSVYTLVEQTWVEGTKVFDRANAMDERYAEGGWAVHERVPALEAAEGPETDQMDEGASR